MKRSNRRPGLVVALLIAAVSLPVAQCGAGDICARIISLDLAAKKAACAGITITELQYADKQACEQALEGCSSADRDKIATALDCLEKLDPCKAGEAFGWAISAGMCVASVGSGLSSTCRLSQQSTP